MTQTSDRPAAEETVHRNSGFPLPLAIGPVRRTSETGRAGPSDLLAAGIRQIERLAGSEPAFAAEIPRMVAVFTAMLGPYVERLSAARVAWPSDVGDDHTPYELSLAIGGSSPELRLLVEPPGADGSLAERWRVAREVVEGFRGSLGAHTERLDRIADLFEPTDPAALFGLWLAVSFWPDRPPELKAYLNLQAHGASLAAGVLEEALARLGLAAAYPSFMRTALRRGLVHDELKYFALDLASHDRSRVKVYARHHDATSADLELVIGARGGVETGEVKTFCERMLGGPGPYASRPVATCWAFTGGAEPSGATVYAPLPYYVRDDAIARGRLLGFFAHAGMDAAPYERGLTAFAGRSLDTGVGLHSYASFKRDHGRPKVTVYFAPELYRVFAPSSLLHPTEARVLRSPEDVVRHYEDKASIDQHPLFRRLAREETRLDHIWTVLANGREGIGATFPRWLASLVHRVPHDGMRTVLAKQLNDELGDGDPTQAHGLLYQKMLDDLGAYRPNVDDEILLSPGRRLAVGLAELYTQRPPYEGVGATLLMEVFGKQADQRVGGILRTQSEIDPRTLTWLVLHETLEEAHAGESLELARMAPDDAASKDAMARGAEELAVLAWRYLDDLYELVYTTLR